MCPCWSFGLHFAEQGRLTQGDTDTVLPAGAVRRKDRIGLTRLFGASYYTVTSIF